MATKQIDRDDKARLADMPATDTGHRGFASMTPERRREIASMGGRASGGNFAHDPHRAAEVGRKGGEHSHDGKHGEQR